MGFKFLSNNRILSVGAFSTYIYTGTAFSATSGYTFSSLLDRDRYKTFEITIGAGSGSATTLEASISATMINTIAIQNITVSTTGAFVVWVNSTVVAPVGYDTANSSWTSGPWGSAPNNNLWLEFASQTAQTITFSYYGDITYGQIIIANRQYSLPSNPNFSDYKPILSGKRMSKKMANGGFVTYEIEEKFAADITLKFVPPTVTAELKSLYSATSSWNFMPFATVTSWDGDIWDVNWTNNYEFLQHARNERANPLYTGKIKLRETP